MPAAVFPGSATCAQRRLKGKAYHRGSFLGACKRCKAVGPNGGQNEGCCPPDSLGPPVISMLVRHRTCLDPLMECLCGRLLTRAALTALNRRARHGPFETLRVAGARHTCQRTCLELPISVKHVPYATPAKLPSSWQV